MITGSGPVTFAFSNTLWDDYCTTDELPEVLADLVNAGLPFSITALPPDDHDNDADADDGDCGIECLTAAERNPSLCR